MKKKLLITLGCSFTEGVGAYNLDKVNKGAVLTSTLVKKYTQRFHTKSWPALLQKKIKYDKLLNLGLGGGSDSFTTKRFIEIFHNNNLQKEYDVLVVWGLTTLDRISFYRNGSIDNIILQAAYEGLQHKYKTLLAYSFLEDYVHPSNKYFDLFLEKLYHVKIMENLTKLYGFNFLYFSMFTPLEFDMLDNFKNLYPDGKYLNQYLKEEDEWINLYPHIAEKVKTYPWMSKSFYPPKADEFNLTSPVCLHPNEYGYEFITNRLFSIIRKKFNSYINTTEPDFYESAQCGTPFEWSLLQS
jgi:hypothetical protein